MISGRFRGYQGVLEEYLEVSRAFHGIEKISGDISGHFRVSQWSFRRAPGGLRGVPTELPRFSVETALTLVRCWALYDPDRLAKCALRYRGAKTPWNSLL